MARRAKPITSLAELRERIAKAPAKAAPKPAVDQARRALLAWVDTTERHGMDLREVLRRLAAGEAAAAIGQAVRDGLDAAPPPALKNAACRSGCAFCCILSGGDGGTITEAEARGVHAALAPFAGGPDGRDWHRDACAALDPATQMCRIYDARPVLCRSFVSTDRAACEANSEGGEVAGPGLLGAHLTYLAALAVTRAALEGSASVKSYALDRITAAALDGCDAADTLSAAAQKPRTLGDALKGSGRAVSGAGRRRG